MVPAKTTRLRIFADDEPKQTPCLEQEDREPGRLAELFEAFRLATGWSLQYVPENTPNQPSDLTWSAPANPGVGDTPGHLRLDSVGSSEIDQATPCGRDAAMRLASALDGLIAELARTQKTLADREAELAADVPVAARPGEPARLAARLQAALKGGAEAVDCRAAALYLLDEATTQLKLRACWGLPPDRLADPPRRLQGSLADLEAMLGHAVVLEDVELQAHFNAPEQFPAAVCVPVSTPSTILGTLWVFSQGRRDFTDRQTGVIELAAGRIAADLERETLLKESIDMAALKRQLTAAERLQRNQLPTISPLVDGWDVAGWTTSTQAVGGNFFDWFTLPDGLLAVALGDVMGCGIEAALSASTLKAALRSHAQYHRDVDVLMQHVNLTLWQGSAGDQFASAFCGLLETASGEIRYCSAGNPRVVLIRPGGEESLSQRSTLLGAGPETDFAGRQRVLRPGEALVVLSGESPNNSEAEKSAPPDFGLAESLAAHLDRSARDLLTLARRTLETATPLANGERTVLVIKRTAP